MQKYVLAVPAAFINETAKMNEWKRMMLLEDRGMIPAWLEWGYGVYGGAFVEDAEHVSFQIGNSCD